MPKLLYLVTEDWFFVSHFLPMARTARAAGFEVVVATRVRNHAARIEAEGFRVVSLENERRSLGPIEALRGFFRIARIVRAERPDIVHCIALRMVAIGGLAARAGGAKRLVLAPTGLGLLWSEDTPVNRAARAVLRFIVGKWLRGQEHALSVREHRRPARVRIGELAGGHHRARRRRGARRSISLRRTRRRRR